MHVHQSLQKDSNPYTDMQQLTQIITIKYIHPIIFPYKNLSLISRLRIKQHLQNKIPVINNYKIKKERELTPWILCHDWFCWFAGLALSHFVLGKYTEFVFFVLVEVCHLQFSSCSLGLKREPAQSGSGTTFDYISSYRCATICCRFFPCQFAGRGTQVRQLKHLRNPRNAWKYVYGNFLTTVKIISQN